MTRAASSISITAYLQVITDPMNDLPSVSERRLSEARQVLVSVLMPGAQISLA